MKEIYLDLLKDPQWQRKRLKILERDDFTCQLCNSKETTLHVHHKKYIKGNLPWEYEDNNFLTLCENCHPLIQSKVLENVGIKPSHCKARTIYFHENGRQVFILLETPQNELHIIEKKQNLFYHIISISSGRVLKLINHV